MREKQNRYESTAQRNGGTNMDFNLTDEEQMFQDTVRKFCEKKLRPRSREIDDRQEIPREILDEMAKMGLLGITVPEKYGGPGGSIMMATLGATEIGRGDISMATAVYYLLEAGWSPILARHGSEEAKNEVLPRVASGEWFLGIASTEPGGGSDLAGMQTCWTRDGNDYIINGEKAFISCFQEAQKYGGGHLTLVRDASKPRDISGMNFFYVPANSKGIHVQKYHNMGRMGISTCGVTYDNVRVPEKYRLGSEGKGFYYAMEGFNIARIFVSAACIGAAERALEIGMEWIKKRSAFGSPIGKFEAVQFELADLYSQVEMARLIIHKAAWLTDRHGPHPDKAAMSEIAKTVAVGKLMAPQIAFDTVRKVMTWHGAFGYTRETDLEMGLRGITSYISGAEGALNIMRIIIGRELLGKEFIPYK